MIMMVVVIGDGDAKRTGPPLEGVVMMILRMMMVMTWRILTGKHYGNGKVKMSHHKIDQTCKTSKS